MRYASLMIALVLCAVASTVLTVDVPWQLAVICVGTFLLVTPGLIALHLLRLPDPLLALVVTMLVGPCLWVLIGTVQLFAGLWAPRETVLVSAVVLGVVTLGLSVRGVRLESESEPEEAGPSRASLIEEYAVEETD